MRATVSIQDSRLEQARELARQRSCTLGEVIEEALRENLATGRRASKVPPPGPLKTFRGNGVHEGIDLSSSSSLLEAMEGR